MKWLRWHRKRKDLGPELYLLCIGEELLVKYILDIEREAEALKDLSFKEVK